MKVRLERDIILSNIEIIAEVDFYDSENPYYTLLKNINTIKELESSLIAIGMEEDAINRIIDKFKKFKIIRNGTIYKDFISRKEFGKYKVTYVDNDRFLFNLPVKIERIKPGKDKLITNISGNPIINELKENNEFYDSYIQENGKFKIVKLEVNKEGKYLAVMENNIKDKVRLIWELDFDTNDNLWYLEGRLRKDKTGNRKNEKGSGYENIIKINKKKNIKLDEKRINSILDNKWDSKNKALNITFDEIRDNEKAKNNFYLDFKNWIKFDEFGEFYGYYINVPIVPIDKKNALIWFIDLFKNKMLNLNKYFSIDELEQIWNNEFENTPISKKFDLNFNFKNIISQFDKGSKVYWQLIAGKDLNPFDVSPERLENKIIIKSKDNIDIQEDILNRIIGYSRIDEFTIIDKYVTNDRHYKSLSILVDSLKKFNNNILINIFTKYDDNEIIKKAKDLNISYNPVNKKLPHNRLWIFRVNGMNRYFNVSHSIDFIKYSMSNKNFYISEDVIFTRLTEKEIDKKFFKILGENYE